MARGVCAASSRRSRGRGGRQRRIVFEAAFLRPVPPFPAPWLQALQRQPVRRVHHKGRRMDGPEKITRRKSPHEDDSIGPPKPRVSRTPAGTPPCSVCVGREGEPGWQGGSDDQPAHREATKEGWEGGKKK